MKEIPLTNSAKVALVDDEDFDRISLREWYLVINHKRKTTQYVRSTTNPYRYIHVEIMGKPPIGFYWDHKNRNPLDNQKDNLRTCTRDQNAANTVHIVKKTTRFRGVFKVERFRTNRHWRVIIRVNRKALHLGYYSDEAEAAKVYDAAARKHYGEFAVTNF